ncbi:hypothetical protein AcW1_003992 [Taiwanofungus camphoratus]|nr:hypothetical protein AcW1_003992 [Antrodia cinnamomea]
MSHPTRIVSLSTPVLQLSVACGLALDHWITAETAVVHLSATQWVRSESNQCGFKVRRRLLRTLTAAVSLAKPAGSVHCDLVFRISLSAREIYIHSVDLRPGIGI